MKKIILAIGLIFSFNSINAQENIVKASLTYGNAGLQYERLIVNRLSILGQTGLGFNAVSEEGKVNLATGSAYKFGARYYLSSKKDNMQGWHIGPEYQKMSTKSNKTSLYNSAHLQNKYEVTSYGIESGSQWIFDSNLSFEFVLGLGYRDVKRTEVYTINSYNYNTNEIGVTAGISLGYAF